MGGEFELHDLPSIGYERQRKQPKRMFPRVPKLQSVIHYDMSEWKC